MGLSGKTSEIVGTLLLVILLSASVTFAIPPVINYQGKLVDSVGDPVNDSVDITFTIYNAPTGGDVLWTETQTVGVVNGIFNVYLGIIEEIFVSTFSTDVVYLGIQVAGNAEMTPRQLYSAAPFAFRAHSADMVAEGAVTSAMIANGTILGEDIAADTITSNQIAADAVGTSEIADGSVDTARLALDAVTTSEIKDGTITDADMDANAGISASKINTSGLDADLLDGLHSAAFVNTAGDTMSGGLSLAFSGGNGINIDSTSGNTPHVKLFQSGVEKASFHANSGDTYIGTTDATSSFHLLSGSGAVRVTIKPDGKVGIGTTAPTSNLDVAGAVKATSFTGDGSGLTGVGTSSLADGSVTGAKIADGTITDADIAAGAIVTAHIGDGEVMTQDILDGTITGNDIADDAVSSISILDGSITDADISFIANISASKINRTGLDADKLDSMEAADFLDKFSYDSNENSAVDEAEVAWNAANADALEGLNIAALDGRYGLAPKQVPRSNTITTLDATGYTGFHTSITIGADGLPVIAYQTGQNSLRVAKCNDSTCTASQASKEIVDSCNNCGEYTSIAIAPDGNPVISYHDGTLNDLKVAKCGDPACATATITTVDSTGDVGEYTSIAIGTDGYPVISYYDATNGNLKVAKCANATCSSRTISILDSLNDVGQYTSIAIGIDGYPVISYMDATNVDLKVAKCGDASCTPASATTRTLDGTGGLFAGGYTSIAIDYFGYPIISYYDATNSDLKVARCGDISCIMSSSRAVDSLGTVGDSTSIAIGADNYPIISYHDTTGTALKVAKCYDYNCDSMLGPVIITVGDTNYNPGYYSSIAIPPDGNPVISYYGGSADDLMVLKCANPLCLNNWTRR